MKKEIVKGLLKKADGVIVATLTGLATGGGLYIALVGLDKRGPRAISRAANLAVYHGLKEGDIQEVLLFDYGIPFIEGKTATCVAMYKVKKIKDNGKYKMQYVAERTFTKDEVEDAVMVGFL